MALKFLDTDTDADTDTDMGVNGSVRLGVEEGRVPMRRSSSYRGTLLYCTLLYCTLLYCTV